MLVLYFKLFDNCIITFGTKVFSVRVRNTGNQRGKKKVLLGFEMKVSA